MGTRWQDTDAPRGDAYDARWARLAAAGKGVHGEADFVEQLLTQTGGRRVLDAGCGTGRVAIELVRRGHQVVGVDVDAGMLDTARAKAPDASWFLVDLGELGAQLTATFDVVVAAGNVMIFLEPGSEGRVLGQLADRLTAGGALVAGFSIRPGGLSLDEYDRLAASVGLTLENRWATWQRDRYAGGDYTVSVHRRPAADDTPTLHIGAVSIDCADPEELADSDGTHTLAMMKVDDYEAPTWPQPRQRQQMHFDISVTDLDRAAARAVAVGARPVEHQAAPELWRVLLDPAGHPFCLTTFGA